MKSIQVTQHFHLEVCINGVWTFRMSGVDPSSPTGPSSRIVRVKYQHGALIERWCRGCDRDADKCRCAKS